LIPCLYFEDSLNIKDSLKEDKNSIKKVIDNVLANKPEKNKWSDSNNEDMSNRAFYETGG
jgi:cyclic pyranopterin phosphate synthase